jgi:RNA polymerase sigma factor (sigma-70 family)
LAANGYFFTPHRIKLRMLPPDFSDKELLKGLISLDESVLKMLYHLYYQSIRKFVRSNSGNDADAKDLFQEAIMVLFQKARSGDFKLTCSPGTYLYSVCRFLWLKELGRRTRINKKITELEEFIDPDGDINEINEKNERLLVFRKCYEKLPEDCKKVLKLFVNGKTIADITRILGYGSEQYTRNRRYRCKNALINSIKSLFD